MQHLNYLPRAAGSIDRVAYSTQVKCIISRPREPSTRATGIRLPHFLLPIPPAFVSSLERTQKSIVFLTSAISRQPSMVP